MKRFLIFALSASVLSILASCSPSVSVRAKKGGSVDVSFKTGFSAETSASLKKIMGIPQSEPIFSSADMVQFLTEAGASSVSARVPSENEVSAGGSLKSPKNSALSATGILEMTENSMSLKIGPEQIRKFYSLLDDNSKSYVDMMMIPALDGESYSVDEYKLMLSALYGPSLASEIADGKVSIELESPNGKKIRAAETLGNLLTLNQERVWKIEW